MPRYPYYFVLILLVFSACKCAPDAFVQAPKEASPATRQESFTQAFTWSQHYDAMTQQLTVDVKLKEGFHAYAAGEKVGVPVDLEISNLNGWRMEGRPKLPYGETKQLGELGTTQVLEDEFVVKAKVTGGKGTLRGILKMQLCSASACDRPREHLFEHPASKKDQG